MQKQPEINREFEVKPTNSSDTGEGIYISSSSSTNSGGFDIPSEKISSQSPYKPQKIDDIIEYTENAKEFLGRAENKSQEGQLKNILAILNEILFGYDLNLPKIRIKLAEDNSIILIWRLETAYFGISIFENVADSSWSLIETQSGVRGYEADGYVNDARIKSHLKNAINFLIINKIPKK